MEKEHSPFEFYNKIESLNIWKSNEKTTKLAFDFEERKINIYDSLALYGKISRLAKNIGQATVYDLKNETGEGKISIYKVFSGIELIYNDVHMEYCNQKQNIMENAIEINHCNEGRYECTYGNGSCCYISQGDFSIGSLKRKKTYSNFPLSHYHGITIIIKLNEVSKELTNILNFLSIDLNYIKLSLCHDDKCCVVRDHDSINRIFLELYSVRNEKKVSYMKIKVIELLSILSDFNHEKDIVEAKYYSNKQVKIVKEVKKMMTNDISRHYTIAELAGNFNISESTLKTCFKGVYGSSIYSYLKNYRLQVSKKMLLESDKTITEIAEDIGYLNPNKFTSAFKNEYGVSPSKYRKNILLDRNLSIWSGDN